MTEHALLSNSTMYDSDYVHRHHVEIYDQLIRRVEVGVFRSRFVFIVVTVCCSFIDDDFYGSILSPVNGLMFYSQHKHYYNLFTGQIFAINLLGTSVLLAQLINR